MRFRSLIPFVALLGAGCISPRHTTFQWASSATAPNHAAGPNPGDFDPSNAVGPHHITTCGDDPAAWAPGVSSIVPIDLTYPQYVSVTRIQVFEIWNPGAIIEVDAEDMASGALDPLWQDPNGDCSSTPCTTCPTAFVVDLNGGSTAALYDGVRVYVRGSIVSGTNPNVYPEIDAVSLEGYL